MYYGSYLYAFPIESLLFIEEREKQLRDKELIIISDAKKAPGGYCAHYANDSQTRVEETHTQDGLDRQQGGGNVLIFSVLFNEPRRRFLF
jgi:hypothetical protein